jgi:hypothetical protein
MKLNFKFSLNNNVISRILKGGSHEYINPVREWLVGLMIAMIAFVSGIIFIALDFYEQLEASPDDVAVEHFNYKETDVKYYADQYRQKEQIFNKMRKSSLYVPPVTVSTTTASSGVVAIPLAEEGGAL